MAELVEKVSELFALDALLTEVRGTVKIRAVESNGRLHAIQRVRYLIEFKPVSSFHNNPQWRCTPT